MNMVISRKNGKIFVNDNIKLDITENLYYKIISYIFTRGDWVHRINEVITILDDSSYNINKISIDCTPPRVLPVYKNRYIDNKNSQYLIPLGILQKETLVNLDISLNGKACTTISSSEHNKFLKDVLIKFFKKDVCDFTPSEELLEIVQHLVESVIENRPHKNPNFFLRTYSFLKNQEVVSASDQFKFKVDIFLSILEILIKNFILFAVIDEDNIGKRLIIKYSYESPVTENINVNSDFPNFIYDKPRVWRQASHHLTLCCPDDLEISVNENSHHVLPTESSTLNKLKFILPEIVDETGTFSFNSFKFSATLTPAKQGIRKWAINCSTLLFIFGVLSIFIRWKNISPNFSVPNSSISILISSFSLIVAILATRKEHIYVAQALKKYREILSLSAVAIFLVAVLSSVPLHSEISLILFKTTSWSLVWISVYIIITFLAIKTIIIEKNIQKISSKRVSIN